MKKKSLVALSSLSLLIGSVITTLPTYAALPTAVSGQTMPSLAPMLEKVSPGVVSIDVEGSHVSKQRIPEGFRFFFGPDFPSEQVQERPFRGLGSGVIIDAKEGYIITNHHVIDGAKKMNVTFNTPFPNQRSLAIEDMEDEAIDEDDHIYRAMVTRL